MAASSVNAAALLGQMTFEEKVSVLGGESFFGTKSIPRLGIPSVKFTDGPNGARGGTINDGVKAACFPASVSLAATWDESLVYRVGVALAEETRTKSAVAVLAPTICPHRSPLGGRNFESFSEDPLLAGILASRYVEGLQDTGIGAVVKHYAANEQETMRRMINVVVGERALREIYLKPFEIVAKTASPWSIMTSYNRLNGHHADSSEYLLRHVLRDQWGYEGLTVSDWGGTNSTIESLNAGLDLEMPGPTVKRKIKDVQQAVEDGKIDPKVIDTSALRVLEFLVKTGKFENPDSAPERSVVDPEHSRLIRKSGADGIVLLRNENRILPLQREEVKSVALLGLAKECLAFGGGSAKVNCHYKITPYDAIQEVLAGTKAEVRYAKGAPTFRNFEPWRDDIYDLEGKPGLTLSRYGNRGLEGPAFERSSVPSGNYRPNFQDSKSRDINASFKLEGTFRPAASGKHNLGFSAMGPSKLFINDELLFECGNNDDPVAFLLAVNGEEQRSYDFVQGQSYQIRLESKARLTDPQRITPNGFFDGLLTARVGFMSQEAYEEDILPEAIEAAKASDVAIVFVGNTTDWETEGQDMESMALPARGSQDRLITEVSKVNKNVIVVNFTGVPKSMPWLDSVSAVLQAWFPGMEAGNSVADVLFGAVNPGGKLPVTMPKTFEDTPCYGNFPGDLEKLEVWYEENLDIGYRFYDKEPSKALFPFGFGLSYTSFDVAMVDAGPIAFQHGKDVRVGVKIRNTGRLAGSEVLQAYFAPPQGAVKRPLKTLGGFAKVTLEPGEEKVSEVKVDPEAAAYWDEDSSHWHIAKGTYQILVGNSATTIFGQQSFEVAEDITYNA